MSVRDLSLPDLLELLVTDATSAPFAFGVAVDEHAGTVDVTMCDLPPSVDPLQPLIGMTAPDNWDAFGLVSAATVLPARSGTARSVDLDGGVWVGILVDRDEQLWASMRSGNGTPVQLPDGGEGHLVDLCKRVLGIPTSPPCEALVRPMLCALWTDEIRQLLANRSDRHREPTWDELAVLHPANQLLPESLYPLGMRAEQAAHALSWADLHQRCCDGSFKIPGISVDECQWFDPGSFSRWIARCVPPHEEIYVDVLNDISYELGFTLLEHVADLLSGVGDW